MMGPMKFWLLYDSVLEAEKTSMMLMRQRKKNTVQMPLSPLNRLPSFLFMTTDF